MAFTSTPYARRVHLRHFYDGYPLCWDYDQDGDFEGTYVENDVTCPACLGYMAEWTD